MNRFIFLFFAATIFTLSCSQNQDNLSCHFQTDGSGLSNGIKAKMFYPCDWKVQGEMEPDMAQVGRNSNGSTGFSLQVYEVDSGFQFTKEVAREQMEAYGKALSLKDTVINSRKMLQAVAEATMEDPNLGTIYTTLMTYSFVYNGKAVNMHFSTQHIDKAKTEQAFENYKPLFEQMAAKAFFE